MNLSRFGRFPVTIYGPGLRAFLSTAVPFAFYPSALLLGREEYLLVGLATPAVGLAVFAVAVFIWRRGVGRYQSAGS